MHEDVRVSIALRRGEVSMASKRRDPDDGSGAIRDESVRPFFQVDNAIVDELVKRRGVFGLGVYCYMKRRAGQSGACWPSYATAARDLRCSRRKVIDEVAALQAERLLRVEHQQAKGGGYGSNMYVLLPVGLSALCDGEASGGGVVHEVHQGGACGALGVVHDVHQGGAPGAPKEDSVEEDSVEEDSVKRETSRATVKAIPSSPSSRRNGNGSDPVLQALTEAAARTTHRPATAPDVVKAAGDLAAVQALPEVVGDERLMAGWMWDKADYAPLRPGQLVKAYGDAVASLRADIERDGIPVVDGDGQSRDLQVDEAGAFVLAYGGRMGWGAGETLTDDEARALLVRQCKREPWAEPLMFALASERRAVAVAV